MSKNFIVLQFDHTEGGQYSMDYYSTKFFPTLGEAKERALSARNGKKQIVAQVLGVAEPTEEMDWKDAQ